MPRKKLNINWQLVEDLATKHCTGTEIAATLGVHPNTLYLKVEEKYKCGFSEFLNQKKENGRQLLKKAMFEQALEGDKTVLIWLSKNYLGFTDTQKIEQKTEIKTEKVDLSSLTDEELQQYIKITDKLTGAKK